MTALRALLALLLLAATAPAGAAGSMRCGARLVDEGKLAAEVLLACGEPAYRDVWSFPGRGGEGWIADVEQWTYNFGPNQLLRVLTLRNGAVAEIESDGYGFVVGDRHGPCGPEEILPGLSKLRLLARCGAPLTRRAEGLLRPLRDRPVYRPDLRGYGADTLVLPVYREEWVYNFGSRYFLRRVTLENGRVTEVGNGDRGTD